MLKKLKDMFASVHAARAFTIFVVPILMVALAALVSDNGSIVLWTIVVLAVGHEMGAALQQRTYEKICDEYKRIIDDSFEVTNDAQRQARELLDIVGEETEETPRVTN